MDFAYSDKVKSLQEKLARFMDTHVYPNEVRFHEEVEANRAKGNPWVPTKLIEELKPKARAEGLWNLFLPRSARAPEGLSNLEYAPLCEIMGRVHWAPEVFNCSAPDTGNMETLERYGSEEHKRQWLRSEPRIRAAVRNHGTGALGAGGVQLLRARYRKHGDAGALRLRGAQEAVAQIGTSNTRRCAKSWDGCTGRRRCSTAPRPIPETWRRWSATAPRSTRGSGSIRCFAERSARLS